MAAYTKQSILERCRSAYYGPCWHGPSLRAALAGTTPDQALAKPLDGAHSIAELVGHIIFWEDVACSRLCKQKVSVTPERNFPAPSPATTLWWKRLRTSLLASHNRLLSTISALSDKDLENMVPGQKYCVGFLLDGVAGHALYHAGQIAMIKKALARRRTTAAGKSRG